MSRSRSSRLPAILGGLLILSIVVGLVSYGIYKKNRLDDRHELHSEVSAYLAQGEFFHRQSKVGTRTFGFFPQDLEPAVSFLNDLDIAVKGSALWFNFSPEEQQAQFDCNGGFNGFVTIADLHGNLYEVDRFEWKVSDIELTTDALAEAKAKWLIIKANMDASLQTSSALRLDSNPWRCLYPDEVDEEPVEAE